MVLHSNIAVVSSFVAKTLIVYSLFSEIEVY